MSKNKNFKLPVELAETMSLHIESQDTNRSAFIKKLLKSYFFKHGVCDRFGGVLGDWANERKPLKGWLNSQNIGEFIGIGVQFTDELANAIDNWALSGNDANVVSVSSLFRNLISDEMKQMGYYTSKGQPTKLLLALRESLGKKEAA
jgi:hypothetical protein